MSSTTFDISERWWWWLGESEMISHQVLGASQPSDLIVGNQYFTSLLYVAREKYVSCSSAN